MKLAASNPAEQRRQLLLLGLLIVVALVLWYTTSSDQAATEAPAAASNPAVTPQPPPAPPAGGRGGRGVQSGNGLPEPVRLADLDPVPEQSAASRNPFGFGSRPAPPPPPAPPQAPPPPPPPPQKPTVPPLPPIPVKFLGFAEDPARPGKVVALGINGGVILAREGDLVDGRYRLLKVALETIVMAYPDGRGQQTIRLSGS